jgi:acetyl esterase/lipase
MPSGRHERTMPHDPREILTRPAPPPDLVLRYGDHPDHVIDLRLPSEQTGPLVVFLHGGFWRAAYSRDHTGPLAADLAARGYPVACPEFRRTGQDGGGWPGTLDDVERALDRMTELVAPHADVSTMVLAGHSAGGQLALINASRSAGVVALAPVADLAMAYRLGLGDDAVKDLLGGGPEEVPNRYDRADPARQPLLNVHAIVLHGDADDRVPIVVSQHFIGRAGPRCELVELTGVDHFALIDPLSSAWPIVVKALALVIDD